MADFFTVFAKTPDVQSKGKAALTAFVITRDMPGVSTGPHEDKMGIRASSTTTVRMDEVRVPGDHVLGGIGQGFKAAMRILNAGRTGLGGGAVGGMKRLIALSAKQAVERQQFGRPISEFGMIKEKVGLMVVDAFAAESVVSLVAGIMDQKYEDFAVEAAISKVFATEALWRTSDEALQIAGGNGYMREFPYEKAVRDSRINRIFEGTNEILRLFIALTAMNDVGQQLKELAGVVKSGVADPIKGFGVLSGYAKKRASLATGLVGDKRTFTLLTPAVKKAATVVEEGTRDVALAADRILRKHGGKVVGKQFATHRLADILIDLYVLSAVLSRVNTAVEDKGEEASAHELAILDIFAGRARRRMRSNLNRIDDNDDELVKMVADQAFQKEGYGWDTVGEAQSEAARSKRGWSAAGSSEIWSITSAQESWPAWRASVSAATDRKPTGWAARSTGASAERSFTGESTCPSVRTAVWRTVSGASGESTSARATRSASAPSAATSAESAPQRADGIRASEEAISASTGTAAGPSPFQRAAGMRVSMAPSNSST